MEIAIERFEVERRDFYNGPLNQHGNGFVCSEKMSRQLQKFIAYLLITMQEVKLCQESML